MRQAHVIEVGDEGIIEHRMYCCGPREGAPELAEAYTGAAPQLPGGKISGYVLVCCPDGQHDAVRAALRDLSEVPFHLAREGTRAYSA